MAEFNPDFLVLHDQYQSTMDTVVLPALESIRQSEKISGFEQKPLSCHLYPAENPRGTVVLVHGFTECAEKYSEMVYSLLQNQYTVVIYDQRGHGYSWRKEKLADFSVTHVDHFQDYVEDLKAVCDHFLPRCPKPWAVFGHSMGGAVVSLFLEQFPEVFSRAVLCAPMIAPNRSGLPYSFAVAICKAATALGRSRERLFLSKPWSGPEDFETSCATDENRFAWYDAIKTAHPEYHNTSPTYGWTLESLRVTGRILTEGAPEKIACPVLLFTADQDFSVLPEPQKQFIARVPQGKHIFVKNSRHEIFRSTDEVFFPWWHAILDFFAEGADRP